MGKIKNSFKELFYEFKKINIYSKLIFIIALILLIPLLIIAIMTDIIFFIYYFILRNIFKRKHLYYLSFTYLILFWENL